MKVVCLAFVLTAVAACRWEDLNRRCLRSEDAACAELANTECNANAACILNEDNGPGCRTKAADAYRTAWMASDCVGISQAECKEKSDTCTPVPGTSVSASACMLSKDYVENECLKKTREDCVEASTTTVDSTTTTAGSPSGSCSIWLLGVKMNATDCKEGSGAPKDQTSYEEGKYCMKEVVMGLVSQGCDVKTDKINDGEGAVASECEYLGLTKANACCKTTTIIGTSYTMCNKAGFGEDEPKEGDFTDALCPDECKGGESSNAVKQVCFSAVLITAGLML